MVSIFPYNYYQIIVREKTYLKLSSDHMINPMCGQTQGFKLHAIVQS